MRFGKLCVGVVVSLVAVVPAMAVGIDFEEFGQAPYSLGTESYYDGADGAGGFASQGAYFNNYNAGWWSGWSVSNVTDTTTPGYSNQYAAYTGGGSGGSEFFGVGYASGFAPAANPEIEFPQGSLLESLDITNTTYAVLSMLNGDSAAKKFGGATGDDEDWFKLTITGLDESDAEVGAIDFYLADYRFADNSADYIVDEWVSIDLSSIENARKLSFTLSSSDVGIWGMNTPAYFAVDDITFVPEPSAGLLLIVGVALLRRR